jgi:DNA polymerase-3 subunit gamma/tau
MSYQVLARKWRPAKFAELVGQEHVKAALINGLSNQRLHHAYLFTGTRGVGKTTIARIFAKSLNCETGISAEPCGQCGTCLDVDAGRFVDLIEIDAASRTKVGDTREILDNVQYAPTRGRYKVYLIDEVHMLSRHSFNALLKTLEEPPEHVKFLLATTDPQKLPVTILSRCLQFNLQALSIKQISEQLNRILVAEQLPFEQEALLLLAKYAKGSMRDGLSLTDQAIAQSGQNVTLDIVQQMMGTVDISWSQNILSAILNNDADSLVNEFSRLTKQNPDIEKVLDDLLSVCHQIALTQIMPNSALLNHNISDFIKAVSPQIAPQVIQIYYQILLQGKRDLKISADPYASFEMICLRLLAFKPVTDFSGLTLPNDTDLSLKKNSEIDLNNEASLTVPLTSKNTLSSQSLNPSNEPVLTENVSDNLHDKSYSVSQGSSVSVDSSEHPKETVSSLDSDLTESGTESELIAQQNFYNDMAQSQGFDPEAAYQTTKVISSEHLSPDSYQSEINNLEPINSELSDTGPNSQPSQSINDVVEPSVLLDVEESLAEKFEQSNTIDINPAPIETSPELVVKNSGFDSPVMAILAARGFDNNLNQQASPESVDNKKNDLNSSQVNSLLVDVKSSEVLQAEQPITPEIEVFESEAELMPLEHEEVRFAHQVDNWASLIESSDLAGRARQLALHGAVEINGNHIELAVKQEFAHLLNEKTEAELNEVVSRLAPECEFIINKAALVEYAPAEIQKDINQNRQQRAEESINKDAMVMTLLNEFDGKIITGSIRPL